MGGIIGIVVVLAMVFGGYLLAGGKLGIIIKALPFEMMMIGGAAAGAFLISNDGHVVKQSLGDIGKVFKGAKWGKKDVEDLLCLLFQLLRVARNNPVEIEEHIENPDNSAIFGKYPKIQKDKVAVDLICDTLRSASMNYDDPHQVEEVLEKQLEAKEHHAMHSSHALQTMADGLPALGIVAAVLGVIKTMASIDQPPEILGKMIGGALVGTFLGVLLAYGFAGPMAGRLKQVNTHDQQLFHSIKQVIVASLHGYPQPLVLEAAHSGLPPAHRPKLTDLLDAMRGR
jgi:chemotaxis protein MotA